MSFQGFLPSLPTFSPLRIPVLTTCFSESNFNTDLTLKERAKVGPRMQTSVSQKSPQSSNPKWSYQIRQSYMTMSGDFGGFILSMQDFIIFFFCPHQHSGHSATTVLSRFSRFFGGDQKCLSANGENIKWTQSRF